jgi:hypothetical protein
VRDFGFHLIDRDASGWRKRRQTCDRRVQISEVSGPDGRVAHGERQELLARFLTEGNSRARPGIVKTFVVCSDAAMPQAVIRPTLYKGYRFPAEIISRCVWLYYRYGVSLRDVSEFDAGSRDRGLPRSHSSLDTAVRLGVRPTIEAHASEVRAPTSGTSMSSVS